MILWPCYSCGSTEVCPHREPELVAWAARVERELIEWEGLLRAIEPLPPGRETERAVFCAKDLARPHG